MRRGGLTFLACAALANASTVSAQDQVPPSSAIQDAIEAGDLGAAAEQAGIEIEACFADAGAEPTVETLAPCASLVMMAAQLSQQAGKYDEAIDFGEAGTNLGVAAFGENSDIVAYSRRARGLALLELERTDEAYRELTAALAAARAVYGNDDPELTFFLGAVASAELAKLKGAEARTLIEEAIALENDELFLAQLRLQYAVALLLLDDAMASVTQARMAADSFAQLLGQDSQQAIEARIRLAGAMNAADRADEALSLLDPTIELLDSGEDNEFLLIEALSGKASALTRLDQWTEAIQFLERASALSRKIYGETSARTVALADRLADMRMTSSALENAVLNPPAAFWDAFNAGDFAQAEAILAPIAKDCGRKYSPDGPDPDRLAPCVTYFTMLSLTYSSRNQLQLAQDFSDLAIATAEANMGDPSAALGLALTARGSILQQRARVAESIPYLERATTMLEGDPSNQTWPKLLLAAALLDTGDAGRSLELVREAIELAGDQHDKIFYLDIEALALLSLGRVSEAEKLLRDAMAANPSVALPTRIKLERALAQALVLRLQFDEAIALLDRLIPQVRATFGEHPLTASIIDILANAHLRKGDSRSAIDAFNESLAIKRALVGEDNPQTAIGYNNLGLAMLETGNFAEAQRLILRALEIMNSFEDFNFDIYSSIAVSFGRLAELVDKPAASLKVSDALVRYAEVSGKLDTLMVATIRISRGTALTRLGRLDEAEAELKQAWAQVSVSDNAQGSAFSAAIALAQLAVARSDRDAARAWFGRAERMARRTFEPTSSFRSNASFLYGAFELETGGEIAAARTLLRRSAAGTLARIESYDDFDAAAQREMRGLSQIFRNQVEAAWKLQEAR